MPLEGVDQVVDLVVGQRETELAFASTSAARPPPSTGRVASGLGAACANSAAAASARSQHALRHAVVQQRRGRREFAGVSGAGRRRRK